MSETVEDDYSNETHGIPLEHHYGLLKCPKKMVMCKDCDIVRGPLADCCKTRSKDCSKGVETDCPSQKSFFENYGKDWGQLSMDEARRNGDL